MAKSRISMTSIASVFALALLCDNKSIHYPASNWSEKRAYVHPTNHDND